MLDGFGGGKASTTFGSLGNPQQLLTNNMQLDTRMLLQNGVTYKPIPPFTYYRWPNSIVSFR